MHFIEGMLGNILFVLIQNLDQWFTSRCRLNIFFVNSTFIIGGRFVQRSEMVCAILVLFRVLWETFSAFSRDLMLPHLDLSHFAL